MKIVTSNIYSLLLYLIQKLLSNLLLKSPTGWSSMPTLQGKRYKDYLPKVTKAILQLLETRHYSRALHKTGPQNAVE